MAPVSTYQHIQEARLSRSQAELLDAFFLKIFLHVLSEDIKSNVSGTMYMKWPKVERLHKLLCIDLVQRWINRAVQGTVFRPVHDLPNNIYVAKPRHGSDLI